MGVMVMLRCAICIPIHQQAWREGSGAGSVSSGNGGHHGDHGKAGQPAFQKRRPIAASPTHHRQTCFKYIMVLDSSSAVTLSGVPEPVKYSQKVQPHLLVLYIGSRAPGKLNSASIWTITYLTQVCTPSAKGQWTGAITPCVFNKRLYWLSRPEHSTEPCQVLLVGQERQTPPWILLGYLLSVGHGASTRIQPATTRIHLLERTWAAC